MCALEYIWKLLGMLASALAWDYKAQLMIMRPTILVCLKNTAQCDFTIVLELREVVK